MIHPILKYREANEHEEKYLLKGKLEDRYNKQKEKISLELLIQEEAENEARRILEEELKKIFN